MPEEAYTEDGEEYFFDEIDFRKDSFSLYPVLQPLIHEKEEKENTDHINSHKQHLRDMNNYLALKLLKYLYNEDDEQQDFCCKDSSNNDNDTGPS